MSTLGSVHVGGAPTEYHSDHLEIINLVSEITTQVTLTSSIK